MTRGGWRLSLARALDDLARKVEEDDADGEVCAELRYLAHAIREAAAHDGVTDEEELDDLGADE